MTMLFDIEKYQHPDSQSHKGDWDGVKYDSAWDDGSAFPEKNYKTSIKEQARNNKTDCWYTPPSIIELVIQVLGEINLDPCADDGRHIPAQEHYTFDDNGLEKPWWGKVYMNPPYSHPGVWMRKLQLEFETGNVDEAIALVPAATDTNWLSPVLKTQPVCFWKGRIKFLGQDYKPKSSARQSHVLVYWGNNWQKFREVFEDYGVVYFPLSAFVSEGNSIEDVVIPVNQTSSTNGKVEMETVLPVNQTGSTNGKLNTKTVLPVDQTGSTNIKTDIEAVLPVDQTGSTNGKLNTKTVPPVDQTGSTKRRSRGEGTGRIHWRAITKKNGKQYQQAWYDWQLIKGKTIYKSTYIPKRLLSQVQKLEAHKAPVREILKILGVNQKLL